MPAGRCRCLREADEIVSTVTTNAREITMHGPAASIVVDRPARGRSGALVEVKTLRVIFHTATPTRHVSTGQLREHHPTSVPE